MFNTTEREMSTRSDRNVSRATARARARESRRLRRRRSGGNAGRARGARGARMASNTGHGHSIRPASGQSTA